MGERSCIRQLKGEPILELTACIHAPCSLVGAKKARAKCARREADAREGEAKGTHNGRKKDILSELEGEPD